MTNLSRRNLMTGAAALTVVPGVPAVAFIENPDAELIEAVEEFKNVIAKSEKLEDKVASMEAVAGPTYIPHEDRHFWKEEDIADFYDPIIKQMADGFIKENDRLRRNVYLELFQNYTKQKSTTIAAFNSRLKDYKEYLAKNDHKPLNDECNRLNKRLLTLGKFIKTYQVKTMKGMQAKMEHFSELVDEEFQEEYCILQDDVKRIESL